MINLGGIIQVIRSGGNPTNMLNQMIGQNPAMKQAMGLLQGKNQQQQIQMLEEMAKQRGTTLQQVAQQMGLPLR